MIRLALLVLALAAPAYAEPSGRKGPDSTGIFQVDGDTTTVFSVVCSSEAWTVVQSSDSIRRSIFMQPVPGNHSGICINKSSGTTACTNSSGGVEFSSGTLAAFTDYTRAAWYCRSRASTADIPTPMIKGYWTWDTGDTPARAKP